MPYLRNSCDDRADKESQQQEGGGQQAPQRFPWTVPEIVVYVEQAVEDAEAHVQTVCQNEAHTSSPPGEDVGQEEEGHGKSQHHQVVPEETKKQKVLNDEGEQSQCLCVFLTFLLVDLFLAHGSKYKTLRHTVDSHEEDVAAVAAQQRWT